MATTTFCDIKMTEKLENYQYENQKYTWEKDAIIAIPYHTASKLVNKYEVAEWERGPYEIKQKDYDATLGRREVDKIAVCEVEKSDGEVCGREKPCAYHDKDE